MGAAGAWMSQRTAASSVRLKPRQSLVWVWAGMRLSRAWTASVNPARSRISRAAAKARTTSSTAAWVSSIARSVKVRPPRLTIEFATALATIWRARGWLASLSA